MAELADGLAGPPFDGAPVSAHRCLTALNRSRSSSSSLYSSKCVKTYSANLMIAGKASRIYAKSEFKRLSITRQKLSTTS
jgi:hypothetical protein